MKNSSPAIAVILSTMLFACESNSEAGSDTVEPVELLSADTRVETRTPTGALGLPMGPPGVTWVGVAEMDITPEIIETYTDENGNHHYDLGEPFDDADGDGVFEPVWIAGFDPRRAAIGVHDPLSLSLLILLSGIVS